MNVKVLIVDDSALMRKLFSQLFSRNGLEVVTARDGEEAIDVAVREKPDVITLDINMPKMNGFEFLEEAVTRFGTDFCRKIVVMLTSSLDARDVARAKACSAIDSYVNKPLSHEHIASIAGKLKAGREKLG